METTPLPDWDQPSQDKETAAIASPSSSTTFSRIARFLGFRILGIAATIFTGIFVTVVFANHLGMLDASVSQDALQQAMQEYPKTDCYWFCSDLTPEQQAQINAANAKYEHLYGLDLPYLPRHLSYTLRALGLELGRGIRVSGASGSFYAHPGAANAILTDLPHTLMLIGSAFVLLFLLGIPLALYLYRTHDSFLDRLFTLLSPISSIPSWVLGVILVLVFAVGLKFLPVGGMYDTVPTTNPILRVLVVLKHMLLPVLAILMSMFFQCIYAWKTFFMLYASEDYVELARAKGLENELLEKQYILKPTLPYIITNFTLLLVSFWQMTMALEKIFNWPGIGRLFINSLPNFLGESMFPGVMPVVVGIIVIFAYILGLTALVLDIIYALVDPRIRIGSEGQTVQPVANRRRFSRSKEREFKEQLAARRKAAHSAIKADPPLQEKALKKTRTGSGSLKPVLREIGHYPTAIFGLVIILLLVAGSIVAVTVFPYNRLADLWSSEALTGKSYVPKLARPIWTNWFLKDKLPVSFSLNSTGGSIEKTVEPVDANGISHTLLTYKFDFSSGGFPQDINLYFTSTYQVKRPFVTLTWITPDGRQFMLDNITPQTGIPWNFTRNLKYANLLQQFPHWQSWFIIDDYRSTPPFHLLFADPTSEQERVVKGTYTLQVDVTNFEPASTVEAELIVLGQVYGWAGTDYMHRDLLVPLLWGMPFALALGLVGASLTTLFSMILAAAGVYFGGWLDSAVQRIIEGVMILPVVAIGVIMYSYYNLSIWTFLAIIAVLNVFGSPTKSFRAALLQIKDSPYIEWAKTSGAGSLRIITRYLLPNILPLLIPQLVALIPSYVFLEATLGIFGIKSVYPTWGKVIFEALQNGAIYGSGYWVLEPIFLLLLTGLAFAMLGFALERILNPRLKSV